MLRNILVVFVLILPFRSIAQLDNCDRVFTKSEHAPTLKVSSGAFQDSLSAHFSGKALAIKNGSYVFRLIISPDSRITELSALVVSGSQQESLKEAISKYALLWKPATQNGYVICAYVKLRIEVMENKFNIEVYQ